MITGKDLIALGYKPNRLFGKALEHVNKYNLSEKDMHDFLKEFFKPNEVIEPFEKPVNYIINLETNNEDEINNFTRKNSDSYNIGNAPNIYGDTSYYYGSTDSYTSDTSSDNSDSFSGFGGGGDFSGGGASGDW